MTGGVAAFIRAGASVWTAGRAAAGVSARITAGAAAKIARTRRAMDKVAEAVFDDLECELFFNAVSIFELDSIRASLIITK
jgi:hypothetical protein